jgi:hypothetical protein
VVGDVGDVRDAEGRRDEDREDEAELRVPLEGRNACSRVGGAVRGGSEGDSGVMYVCMHSMYVRMYVCM